MDNIFKQFLTKEITPKQLLKKLIKANKYISSSLMQEAKLNSMIDDIKYIIATKNSKEQYEDILILFDQYLKTKKANK